MLWKDEEEEDEDDFDYSVLEAACSIEVGEVDLDVPAVPILASMRESLLEEESPDHRLHSDIPTDMCQVDIFQILLGLIVGACIIYFFLF